MDTNQMRYIVELSKEGCNITKASKRLFITQAALSKSLHGVEDKLDTELFIRENGRLTSLSPAGMIFVNYAEKILSTYEQMREELGGFKGSNAGLIKIGIPGDIIDVLFCNSIPNLMRQYPSVQIDIHEDAGLRLERRFGANDLDILVCLYHGPADQTLYEQHELLSQPYGVILDKSNPLANEEAITWSQIKDCPLALPTRSYTRMFVQRKLMELNWTPTIAINARTHGLLTGAVKGSKIITILPKIFLKEDDQDELLWRPIEDTIDWNVEVVMKKRHRELGDMVCKVFDEFQKLDLNI